MPQPTDPKKRVKISTRPFGQEVKIADAKTGNVPPTTPVVYEFSNRRFRDRKNPYV
ncbi:MAG: hypothetical protein AB8B85_02740 [Paracoccaceae bacterium]